MQDWLRQHQYLWWWVADVTKISDASILEGVMNYGDWQDFLYLKKKWGLDKIKGLFMAMTNQRRMNLRLPAQALFQNYLTCHAQ